MAARRERGLFDPKPAAGDSPFDHHIFAIASDGDLEEGVSAEASSLAGHQQLGNLVAALRRQPDLDRGRHQHRLQRGRRLALRGLRLARPDGRLDERRQRVRRERQRALRRVRGRQGRDERADAHQAADHHRLAGTEQAEHRQGPRLRPGRGRGRRPRRRSWASTRSSPSSSSDEVIAHTRRPSTAAQQARAAWQGEFDAWAAQPGERPRCSSGSRPRKLPDGWARAALPVFEARQGRRHPRRVREGPQRDRARCCPSCGAAPPTSPESNNTTIEGSPLVHPAPSTHRRVDGQPVRPGAALRHPRARHGARSSTASSCTAATRPFGGTFLIFSDYMRPAVRLGGADGAAGRPTSGPTTPSGSARTGRPTSRSSSSPRCAPSRAWTSSGPADANETACGLEDDPGATDADPPASC